MLATTCATGNLDRSGAALPHFNEPGQRDFLKLRALAETGVHSRRDLTGLLRL